MTKLTLNDPHGAHPDPKRPLHCLNWP